MHVLVAIRLYSTLNLVLLLILTISFLFYVFKLLGGKGCVLFRTISHAMLGVQYISLELNKEIDMEEDKVSHK